MFGGGRGGPHGILERETSKPKKVSETLRRLGGYFKPFWPMLLLAVTLIVVSTWAQVTSPELLGQAVDCYLSPTQAASSFGNLPGAATPATQPAANTCWYDPAAAGALSNDARLAGLGSIVLKLLGLYALGAVATGLTFYSMS
jgi:ATP-binding cassette subfamily B multidrug efflux pump